jgi:UDP-N-acetylmuramoyl-L-alanyl-D-glutamate--2,6-diaminopimelate ligase
MILSDLIAGMPTTRITGDTAVEVRGITKDSRKVGEGFVFFATGTSEKYIAEAVRKGAVAIVSGRQPDEETPCSIVTRDPLTMLARAASKFYGFPSRKLHVTGITGTNGKTTTTYLMESMLKESGAKAGLIGTISYRYDCHTLKAENTTPGAADLQALLKDMEGCGVDHVVMEVSSHALDQGRVEGVDFDAAIFTNLTRDHLDYHGDLDSYKEAKRLFFTRYLKESKKAKKHAILNLDDPLVREFVPGPPVETLFYSLKQETDACLLDYTEEIEGLKARLSVMGSTLSVSSPLLGRFNVSNILAACLFGHVAAIPREAVIRGVEALAGVPGRMERVPNGKGVFVFIDYAHTPDALRNVLEMVNRLKKGRLILIFGCGGDRDKGKRPVMGETASRLADFSIITSDNPRGEEPSRIIQDVRQGFQANSFKIVEDRRSAIEEGVRMAQRDDVLVIAGKGHEDYQIIGNKTIHFSDREVVEESFGVARG